ncbi:MAG: Gfo/Idh/MocA family oxidoreductase, partial [Planctomycetaceae bacterium]|nr:Gfo/Idh/MocA family oxidoreductase [Planctomycetaceae bacterium]
YSSVAEPIRVGVIGTGDEGSVLIGALNPEYVQVVAIADLREYNVHRAFHGDYSSPAAMAARPGLMSKYGWKTESEARKHVKVYTDGYQELLANKDIQAVITAVPLHLHAQVAVDAMLAGKHVLTEKLMAKNIAQCKLMGRIAAEKNLYLATGHQRHYSVLYDNAVNLIQYGLLGELHHIRAQWHRGNLPGRDSWQMPVPGGEIPIGGAEQDRFDKIHSQVLSFERQVKKEKDPVARELLEHKLAQWKAWDSDSELVEERALKHGFQEFEFPTGHRRSALEELARWRLWERTGGGLMAELGSHQMDAAGIFCSALRRDGKKAQPLSVHAVGGRHLFGADRHVEDHVYCMLEFPAPGYEDAFDVGYADFGTGVGKVAVPSYENDDNKKIVVTYSSINGNGFGGYGEVVMGTKGTLVLEKEKEMMLYKGSDTTTKVGVKKDAGGPTLDTQASGEAAPVAQAAQTGPVSRGYTEEIEHWAYCISHPSPENQPRCNPHVALSDAVIALTTNVAIRQGATGKGGHIQFQESWYDVDNDATPDGSDMTQTKRDLQG